MQVPMEISVHGVEVSPRHEARIRREAERLHRFAQGLVSCHVAAERPHRRRHTANTWRVRVELTMPPGKELVVSKTSRDDEAPDALLLAVREAFGALERRLKRTAAQRRGDVKRRAQPTAIVSRVRRDEGYRFIRTLEGQEIYFHRNVTAGEYPPALRKLT